MYESSLCSLLGRNAAEVLMNNACILYAPSLPYVARSMTMILTYLFCDCEHE